MSALYVHPICPNILNFHGKISNISTTPQLYMVLDPIKNHKFKVRLLNENILLIVKSNDDFKNNLKTTENSLYFLSVKDANS